MKSQQSIVPTLKWVRWFGFGFVVFVVEINIMYANSEKACRLTACRWQDVFLRNSSLAAGNIWKLITPFLLKVGLRQLELIILLNYSLFVVTYGAMLHLIQIELQLHYFHINFLTYDCLLDSVITGWLPSPFAVKCLNTSAVWVWLGWAVCIEKAQSSSYHWRCSW